MASLIRDASGNFLVRFRYGGTPYKRSADTRDERNARAVLARVEDTIFQLKRGLLVLPDGAEPGAFITSGGKLTGKPVTATVAPKTKPLTLGDLFKLYDDNFPAGAKAETTMQTERHHKTHLLEIFGQDAEVETLRLTDVQRYANKRSQATWRDKTILSPTILKELGTFRVIWNWGRKQGHVSAAVPYQDKDLNFARTEDKPPFQTFDAILKTVKRGGLSETEVVSLWESLYLTLEEVHEVLEYVRTTAMHPFIYPMFLFAAMTGARRSEICNSRIEDWDIDPASRSGTVKLRERKRKRGRSTFRTVDVNTLLASVMGDWLATHPGGQFTISKDGERLTVKMATDHFKRTLARSKWSVIPGFHTFRHSFASILAASGQVDDTTIDTWMGHQTQEQRQRYRHLFPKNRKRSIELLVPGEVR